MVSLNPVEEVLTEHCEYDENCGKCGTNRCRNCDHIFCLDHYLEHQTKLQKHFEYSLRTHDLLSQKLKTLIKDFSSDAIFDLVEQIYEFKIKSIEIEKIANKIQQQLNDLNEENKQEKVIWRNNIQSNKNNGIENEIELLRKSIKQLKLKYKEIDNLSQKRLSREQSAIPNINIHHDHSSPISQNQLINTDKNLLTFDYRISNNSLTKQKDTDSMLTRLLVKQTSPSTIHPNEFELSEDEDETSLEEVEEEEYYDDDDDETIGVYDPDKTPRINKKIRLSNNIVCLMRGPFKVMLDGTMHAFEGFAKEPHAKRTVVQAITHGLIKQKQLTTDQQPTRTINSLKSAYVKITSDWIFEGENLDKGFTSASIWMRNPQGQRILVKTQDITLCAVNEWVCYVLGRQLGLPVNEAQIGIYQKNLVTLHTDVTLENEKVTTFMDLPKPLRKKLLADPIFESMDLFDQIIQNVDRNPRNILITISNTDKIDDDTTKLKVHLIDHGSCFGAGKLNGISVIASKLHARHFAVVKFNPVDQAKKFERYLNKLPTEDRILMKKTLNRFAAINDEQIESWLTEVKDLLSNSQYDRIQNVLIRQRDIVKQYITQWGLTTRSSSIKSNGKN